MDRAPSLIESVDAALAHPAFATLPAGAPVLAALGEPPRLAFANDSAKALFRGDDVDAVAARCLYGDDPGARRLAQLALTLTPGGPPRLERLRFVLDGQPVALTFLCRRSPGPDPIFVAAALDARPSLRAAPPKAALEPPAATPLLEPAQVEVERAVVEHAAADPAPAAAPLALEPSPAPAARTGKVRFVWRTDAAHRFTMVNEALCATLGLDAETLIGASFLTLAETSGFDPDGRLREVLTAQKTWSGVDAFWPMAGGEAIAPVTLGGAPTFDRARAFSGYNGFGVIHLEGVTRRAPAPEAPRDEAPVAEAPAVEETPADAPPSDDTPAAAEPEQPSLFATPPAPARGAFVATNVVALDAWKNGAATQRTTQNPDAPAPTPQDDEARAETHDAPVAPAPYAEELTTPADTVADTAPEELPEAPETEPVAASEPIALADEDADATERAPTDAAPADADDDDLIELTRSERSAFREIARALGARLDRTPPAGEPDAPAPRRVRDGSEATTRETIAEADTARAPVAPPPDVVAPPAPPARDRRPAAQDSFAAADLLDRIELGLLVCREGKAIYLNKALASLLGYADAAAFDAEDGLARMFRGRAPESAGAEGGDRPLAVVTRDGDVVSLEARLQAFDWQGAPATLITFRPAVASELTQRIRTLENDAVQREARARELHAILDTATDGVAVLDEDGRILSLNKSAEALFGYEQNEVAGENFTILFARESFAAAQDYLAGLQSNGVRSVLNDGREVTGRARQGGQIPMFMTLGRVGDEPSAKFCAVLRDLTQWKNAERELKEARREAERTSALKSDFLAKISHEVRTPLNAILGFAEVMRDERFGPLGNERYRDYLKDIHASGSHVLSLVNDLLDLSKIEAGKLDLSFESVDANKIVSECVSIMQSQAIRERVILRLSLAPRLPNIVADERSLRQIVLNILSNAVKFNQPGGQVIVSTALTDAGHAVIRMRDTGIGMSDREVETALEPFRQIETARHTTGTGLGLPLTKALVEANRATFTIRSRKGEGTLVEVAFPSTRVLAE